MDDNSEDVASILIHAPAKVGKTTLSWTAPGPMIILDAEGGTKFLSRKTKQKIMWDPMKGEHLPEPESENTVCVVKIQTWETLRLVYQHISQMSHGYTSIIVDSVTELQRKCKENLKPNPTDPMRIQDWGVLLTMMDVVIRGIRDLTLQDDQSVRCVVFIAETVQRDGMWRPKMQGQIGGNLPYWVDICGYLFKDYERDSNGQPIEEVRRLLITPNEEYEAGERVQGRLPGIITNANITDMMKKIYEE